MRRTFSRFLFLVLLATFAPSTFGVTPLKDGDRVVFYGDSITQQQTYTRYMQQYIYCRYPDLQVRFFNAGWGGDRAPGAVKRLERDVLSLNPTVVTLFFGMNDGSYRAADDTIVETYRQSMDELIGTLKSKGIRVIVYAPGCVDYDKRPNLREADYNATLATLGDVAEELAQKHGCEFVDVHEAMLKVQTAQKAKDPSFTMIPDGVHPDKPGHLVMARAMLTPLAEPMPVIEAPAEAVSAGGAAAALSFKAPSCLPFWIDPASQPVAEECGMLEFASPKLVVKGLPAGVYEVTVDGQGRTQATAEQLAAGLPVVANTPRGKKLHDLITSKEAFYFTTWRDIQLPLSEEQQTAKTVEAMLAADDALQALIREVASPTELSFVIHPKPEGENLALKKKYDTSDPNTHNWGIGGLTDGSWEATSRTCFATNDSAEFPKTVTIDLERSAPVNTVVLGVPPFGSTKTVAISVSEDGTEFTEVGRHAFSIRKEERYTCSFPPQSARFVRLTYVDHHPESVNYTPSFAFTTEVEVYAGTAN